MPSPPRPMSYQLSLAPERLWQAINPRWFHQQGARFGFINIDLGRTSYPEIEQRVLDEVGSYGRQIGRIGDALDVILRRVDLGSLDDKDRDAIDLLRAQLAEIRRVKRAMHDDR